MMRDAKLAGIKQDLGTMVGHACTTCIGVLTHIAKTRGVVKVNTNQSHYVTDAAMQFRYLTCY